ncbi:MAG: hypothetical protein GQ471_00800 [Nitrosopumilus sp.]|nr:hypothetical protein [Nitrosopumilus sp.]
MNLTKITNELLNSYNLVKKLTLRGKENHYNIKFLKGYDHSISIKDSKIILVF